MEFPPEPYHRKTYYWDFLNGSQWWTREKLEELQLEGLKGLTDFARQRCPFYRNLPEIKTLDDLKQIPILTKGILNSRFNEILVQSVPHVLTTTGGTVSKTTVAGDKRILAGLGEKRYMSWYPVQSIERCCYLWGSVEAGQGPKREGHKLWLPVEQLRTRAQALGYLDRIRSFKPQYIKAYAGPMGVLAHYALEEGWAGKFRVGVIATHCETLLPEARKEIEEAFKCEVFNFYGARDLGSQAQDCKEHKDLHLQSERYILEIEDGRFLFTDLYNYASPLIRYENQDIGEWGEPCKCGRGLHTIKPLVGRVLSYLQTKNDEWVTGFIVYLPIMYYDNKHGTDIFKWVEAYQIRQREIGKITVLLKPWDNARPPTDLTQVMRVLREYAKPEDFDVQIEIATEIPKSSTGKQMAVDTTLRRW